MTSQSIQETANLIASGQTSIGIELGSTRIKTVMIGPDNSPIASASHDWENALVDGIWSYSVDDIWGGVQSSYKSLADAVKAEFGVEIKSTKSLGFSGMMHATWPSTKTTICWCPSAPGETTSQVRLPPL